WRFGAPHLRTASCAPALRGALPLRRSGRAAALARPPVGGQVAPWAVHEVAHADVAAVRRVRTVEPVVGAEAAGAEARDDSLAGRVPRPPWGLNHMSLLRDPAAPSVRRDTSVPFSFRHRKDSAPPPPRVCEPWRGWPSSTCSPCTGCGRRTGRTAR